MKTRLIFLLLLITNFSYTQSTVLSEEDKKAVETEIHQYMDSLIKAFETVIPEDVFNFFLQTDEFCTATQGYLITNPSALLYTMKVHMATMKNQSTKPVADKIFVIDKDAVVISTSKVTTITFKNDSQVTMPFALTMLLVKREGTWKIAHYHN